MSTLKELTYRVWRILDGGNIADDSRFTYREIRDTVRSAIFSVLKANYFETRNSEDEFKYGNDDIFQELIIETKIDDSTCLPYIDVSQSISVPATNRLLSISDINPYSRASKKYIPVRKEERFVGQLQPPIPKTVLYERTGGRIYFFNDTVKEGTPLKVVQKYAITDNDDEELNIPSEYELQIIDAVTKLLDREIRLHDISNDGAPNIINR